MDGWVWSPLFPCGRGLESRELMLEPKDLIQIHHELTKLAKELENELTILAYAPGVTPLQMLEPTLRCGAANYYIQLMPNGDVYPCSYFRDEEYKLGNLLMQDFESIIENPIAKTLRKPEQYFSLEGECRHCPLVSNGYCNTGCKAMKLSLGIPMLGKHPYCTKHLLGSPMNQLYHKLKGEGS